MAELVIESGGLDIAVTVRGPSGPPNGQVIFAFAGGGYGKGYWDLPGDHSQAAWHAGRGAIVIAIDHPGTGASGGDPAVMSLEQIAAIDAAVVAECAARLAQGTLLPDLAAVSAPRLYGMGQSMGGFILVLMQHARRPFRAIALLGSSFAGTVLPRREGAAASFGDGGEDPAAASARANRDIDFRYAFHWEESDVALVEADMADGYPFRTTAPAWGSLGVPRDAARLMMPRAIADEAAAIDIPVFLSFGERDISPDPHREVAMFPASRDIALLVLPRSAHMHNFSPEQRMLWARIKAFLAER